MAYVYTAMWVIVGLLLIFRMGKENRVFAFAGGFFLLLGGWWLANTLLPAVNLFAGVWGWVLRGITAIALVVLCVAFFRENKRKEQDGQDKGE